MHSPQMLYEVFPSTEASAAITLTPDVRTPAFASGTAQSAMHFLLMPCQTARVRKAEAFALAFGFFTYIGAKVLVHVLLVLRFSSEDLRRKDTFWVRTLHLTMEIEIWGPRCL